MSRRRHWGDMTFGFWLPRVKAMMVLEYRAPWGLLGLRFPWRYQNRWSNPGVWESKEIDQNRWMRWLKWSRTLLCFVNEELYVKGCTESCSPVFWKVVKEICFKRMFGTLCIFRFSNLRFSRLLRDSKCSLVLHSFINNFQFFSFSMQVRYHSLSFSSVCVGILIVVVFMCKNRDLVC